MYRIHSRFTVNLIGYYITLLGVGAFNYFLIKFVLVFLCYSKTWSFRLSILSHTILFCLNY